MEDYVKEINKEIDNKVEEVLQDLKELAEENNIQYEYVLETYRDKIRYRVDKIIKT